LGEPGPSVKVERFVRDGELVVRASAPLSEAVVSEGEALDLCYVAAGVATHELLDTLSGGWAGIRFPNEYVIRGEVVGRSRAWVEGGEAFIEVRLNCHSASGACADGGRALEERLRLYLSRVFSDSKVECCLKFGSALAGRGERVEVRLRSGEVVVGDVMGYGFRGELMLVTEDGGVRLLRPSEVVDVKTLWP